jgi:MFS family permease
LQSKQQATLLVFSLLAIAMSVTPTSGRTFAPYRAFLQLPDIRNMLLAGLLARMPVGMMGLSMLLFVREELGSLVQAGITVGAFFISAALVAPMIGRVVDRIGPKPPLYILACVQPVAFLLMIIYIIIDKNYPATVACAVVAGAAASPVSVLTRTIWRLRFAGDEGLRKMAFTLDSIMVEINFTIGPLLVAVLVAVFSPRIAFLVSVMFATIAVGIFLASPALKYWQQTAPEERHFFGPLTHAGLRKLYLISFGFAFCLGILEVSYPAYGTVIAIPAFGGVLLALNSIGSAVGGLIYGTLTLRASMGRQFAISLAILALPLIAHAVMQQQLAFAIFAFLAGLAIAPAFTAQIMLVTDMTPPKYATEAFTWSSTCIVSGIGLGTAGGAALIEKYNIGAPFLVGGIVMILLAAISFWLYRPRKSMTGAS